MSHPPIKKAEFYSIKLYVIGGYITKISGSGNHVGHLLQPSCFGRFNLTSMATYIMNRKTLIQEAKPLQLCIPLIEGKTADLASL